MRTHIFIYIILIFASCKSSFNYSLRPKKTYTSVEQIEELTNSNFVVNEYLEVDTNYRLYFFRSNNMEEWYFFICRRIMKISKKDYKFSSKFPNYVYNDSIFVLHSMHVHTDGFKGVQFGEILNDDGLNSILAIEALDGDNMPLVSKKIYNAWIVDSSGFSAIRMRNLKRFGIEYYYD